MAPPQVALSVLEARVHDLECRQRDMKEFGFVAHGMRLTAIKKHVGLQPPALASVNLSGPAGPQTPPAMGTSTTADLAAEMPLLSEEDLAASVLPPPEQARMSPEFATATVEATAPGTSCVL